MSDGVRIWAGRAKHRQLLLGDSCYALMRMLRDFKLLPERLDDWPEDVREYTDRWLDKR